LFVWVQNYPRPLLLAAILGALLIVFAHRGNIGRLAHGTESQFR
jgi:glycerol-3-phosphate acyltransferase PlsY